MWTRTYLALVVVRLYLALQPSYIHPDENFQGPEVIAGMSPTPSNILPLHLHLPFPPPLLLLLLSIPTSLSLHHLPPLAVSLSTRKCHALSHTMN